MNLNSFIARRYLFSKKKQNAINIISIISVVGVAIGTTALIVILSVFNGIDDLLTEATDSFTSDIIVSPAKGKFIENDETLLTQLKGISEIKSFDVVVEENSLAKSGDKLVPVIVKGIDDSYSKWEMLENTTYIGKFGMSENGFPTVNLGYGVASTLNTRLGFESPIIFYYPDRTASATSSSLNNLKLFPYSILLTQQDIDGKYVVTGIESARQLFDAEGQFSKIEITLNNPDIANSFKKKLASQIDDKYKVQDKYDANSSFYAMMKSEKLATFLILLFILLIASFNIIGSVSMLILDKKEDISIYKALGMSNERIINIFKLEGNLITGFGAIIGFILGLSLCFLQERYGFISLGGGDFIVSAYPVKVVFSDVVLIMFTVLVIGYMASLIPVNYLVKKIVK